MKRQFYFFIIVLACSCEQNKSYPFVSETNDYCYYFPLRLGNYWKYELDSVALNGISYPIGYMTMSVEDTGRWGNDKTFKLNVSYTVPNFPATVYWLRHDRGYLTTETGDVWVAHVLNWADTVQSAYISNVKSVNRRQFNYNYYHFSMLGFPCTKVESLDTKTLDFISYDDYYSKDVGLVYNYTIFGYRTSPRSQQLHYEKKLVQYRVVL